MWLFRVTQHWVTEAWPVWPVSDKQVGNCPPVLSMERKSFQSRAPKDAQRSRKKPQHRPSSLGRTHPNASVRKSPCPSDLQLEITPCSKNRASQPWSGISAIRNMLQKKKKQQHWQMLNNLFIKMRPYVAIRNEMKWRELQRQMWRLSGTWKHKTQAGAGPRLRGVPGAFRFRFSVFGICRMKGCLDEWGGKFRPGSLPFLRPFPSRGRDTLHIVSIHLISAHDFLNEI